MRRVLLAAWFGLAAGLAIGAGCYHPNQPECAFSCAKSRCPEHYSCGADGYCHHDEKEDVCALGPDVPPDSGAD